MKKIYILCALILLLVGSISAHAGVTDGQITAYRFAPNEIAVIFTDTQSDDPNSNAAPLGAGRISGSTCEFSFGLSVDGLVCSGTSGEPVADYIVYDRQHYIKCHQYDLVSLF